MAWVRNSGQGWYKAKFSLTVTLGITSHFIQGTFETTCLVKFNPGITFRQNLLTSL